MGIVVMSVKQKANIVNAPEFNLHILSDICRLDM